jgi:hypothetical protein
LRPPVSQRGPLVRFSRKVSAFRLALTCIIPKYLLCFHGIALTVLRGGFGIAPFRPSASDFHGSLTIANSVLKATYQGDLWSGTSALCCHNALGLYPAPFWYPTHWRVELRCLHIRKRAQGDPTTVRDYS